MDGRRFRRLVSALQALAAARGEEHASKLEEQLHPAVGLQLGHRDDLTAGTEDNGAHGDSV